MSWVSQARLHVCIDSNLPLSTDSQKPKRKEINKYVKPHAAHKWYDLGLELEVGDESGIALGEIKEKYSDDKENCFDCMIDKWFKEGDPKLLTWKELIDCLKEVKANEAVTAIRENLFAGINTLYYTISV